MSEEILDKLKKRKLKIKIDLADAYDNEYDYLYGQEDLIGEIIKIVEEEVK